MFYSRLAQLKIFQFLQRQLFLVADYYLFDGPLITTVMTSCVRVSVTTQYFLRPFEQFIIAADPDQLLNIYPEECQL